MATIARDIHQIFSTPYGIDDRHGLKGLVRVIGVVELNAGIK